MQLDAAALSRIDVRPKLWVDHALVEPITGVAVAKLSVGQLFVSNRQVELLLEGGLLSRLDDVRVDLLIEGRGLDFCFRRTGLLAAV
jgi:hypothetical protein